MRAFILPAGESKARRTADANAVLSRGEQAPLVGDPLERTGAAVLEADARPGDEVPNGAGDEHLARTRERPDPRRDVHGDPADVVVDDLDFAGVESDPHLET